MRVCEFPLGEFACAKLKPQKFIPINSHSFLSLFSFPLFLLGKQLFLDISFFKGQWVWIKPPKMSEFATPIGCQIIRFDRGKVLIRNDDGDESWIKPDQVKKNRFSL